MWRPVLAVIAGYAVWTVIWLGGGQALLAAFPDALPSGELEVQPITSTPYLASALVLSIICSLAAGAFCRIGASRWLTGALVLSVLLLLTGIGVQASAWSLMPVWYHLAFLALLVPVTLLGARLTRPKPRPIPS
jgi:hypothetical protein